MAQTNSLYTLMTEKIIEAVKAGGDKWVAPWKSLGRHGLPCNMNTKKPYRGMNSLMLSVMGTRAGYTSNQWATFKQIATAGGMVRKGEKSTQIVFFKPFKVKDKTSGNEKTIPYAQFYNVFNVQQASGLKIETPAPLEPVAVIAEAEKVFADYLQASGVTVGYGGDSAHYEIERDHIQLPERGQFKSSEDFYMTAFHEATHSTGIEKRLDREGFMNRGKEFYSREELVAEVGASFLAAHVGMSDKPTDNSVAYLKGWLSRLQDNPLMLSQACSQAQKAVDFILNGAACEVGGASEA
jgi:antirestriction protein ArdC